MVQSPFIPPEQVDEARPLSSLREKREMERQVNSIHRQHHALTAVCILLVLAMGAAIWYEYPVLVAHKADLMKLPALTQSVDTITSHLGHTDAQIEAWSRQQSIDRQLLQTQMAKVTRDVRTGVAAARKEVSDAANAAYTRLETRVSEQIDGIQTRLANVETKRDADQKQIAALQEELARVRQGAAQQSDRIATLEHQVEQSSAAVGSQIAGLQRDQGRDRHDVDAINSQLAVEKLPFEAQKGQDRELADGISLHITKTVASRGEFDGWMALKSGQRTIQLRHQGIQEPLSFYGPQDGKRRELVITNVDRNSVAGYLLLPKEPTRQADTGE